MKRLPASSLVEVTVAAVILVIVFSLALAVCARLVRQGPGPRQLMVRQLVQERAARTIRSHKIQSSSETVGDISLEQTLTPVTNHAHLYRLQVEARLQDSVLTTYQELVYLPAL